MWGGFPAEPDDLPQKQTPTPRPAAEQHQDQKENPGEQPS
jgi:hypothetical protein